MHKVIVGWIAAGLIFVCGPVESATVPQHFTLPAHGTLLLNVPESWKSDVKQPKGGLPPTIGFGPRSGAPFLVLITAIWGIGPGASAPDDTKIRSTVATGAKSAESRSVEGSLSLRDIVGPSGRGYYFVATDRAPAPGEWKTLTQGAMRTGAIALSFTILTNAGQELEAKAALEMIRLAVQQPGDTV
jgi:hypothetical protein